ESSRIPLADEHEERPQSIEGSPAKRPQSVDGIMTKTTAVVFFSLLTAIVRLRRPKWWSVPMQRKLRLRKKQDFNKVYRQGRSFANAQFVVYWRKQTEPGCFRLGVSASAKLGGAVVRNRLRRRVKEIV